MTKIYLVRHGVTEYNATLRLQGSSDIPLNSQGEAQAVAARDYLKDIRFDALLSSPLSRAYRTGEIINEFHNLSIKTLDDLKEQAFGIFEGDHIEHIRLRYPEGDLPGSETPEALTERGKNVIEYINQHHSGETILVTAHSRIIKAILSLFSSEVDLVFTKLENCSVSILSDSDDHYLVTDINIKTQ
jgi:uncharacterized phosphatase